MLPIPTPVMPAFFYAVGRIAGDAVSEHAGQSEIPTTGIHP